MRHSKVVILSTSLHPLQTHLGFLQPRLYNLRQGYISVWLIHDYLIIYTGIEASSIINNRAVTSSYFSNFLSFWSIIWDYWIVQNIFLIEDSLTYLGRIVDTLQTKHGVLCVGSVQSRQGLISSLLHLKSVQLKFTLYIGNLSSLWVVVGGWVEVV